MASLDLAKTATAPAQINGTTAVAQNQSFAQMLRAKLANTLTGKKADDFVTSVVSLVNNDPKLRTCDTVSLIASCLQALSLNLSLNKGLGQAYVIPFHDRKNNRTVATFQCGFRGFVQLAIRSGQYKRLNVLAIKEGELVRWDALNEEIEFKQIEDEAICEKTKTIGYYAMFEYVNGFRKALYWSKAKMEHHAAQYSQTYKYDLQYNKKDSFWSKDFDAMAYKTMLKQLISKWGIMSTELQTAYSTDGRAPTDLEGGFGDVLDSPVSTTEVVNVETGEITKAEVVQEQQPENKKAQLFVCPDTTEKMMLSECKRCPKHENCPAHQEEVKTDE